MSTRSITRIFDDERQVANMYRQSDGYPTGHGQELFEFLDGMRIVNGITYGETDKQANGAGCLAAQLVAHFKDGVGGIYLVAGHPGDYDQEYEYQIIVTSDIEIKVYEKPYNRGKNLIFSGNVTDFGTWCKTQ